MDQKLAPKAPAFPKAERKGTRKGIRGRGGTPRSLLPAQRMNYVGLLRADSGGCGCAGGAGDLVLQASWESCWGAGVCRGFGGCLSKTALKQKVFRAGIGPWGGVSIEIGFVGSEPILTHQ